MVSKRLAPPPLLGARKQLLHSPSVETEVAMRRTMRQSLIRRTTASSVKEEDEEEEGDDDEGRLSTISVQSQVPSVSKLSDKDKLTIISPSALAASPTIAKRPKSLPRGATESIGLGRTKEIRPTLKELHGAPGANASSSEKGEGKDCQPEPPQPLTRILSRGATEPLIRLTATPTPDTFVQLTSQASSSSETPSDSQSPDSKPFHDPNVKGRKHSDYKPSKLVAAASNSDNLMDGFGIFPPTFCAH